LAISHSTGMNDNKNKFEFCLISITDYTYGTNNPAQRKGKSIEKSEGDTNDGRPES
jgi:hypothetical protein